MEVALARVRKHSKRLARIEALERAPPKHGLNADQARSNASSRGRASGPPHLTAHPTQTELLSNKAAALAHLEEARAFQRLLEAARSKADAEAAPEGGPSAPAPSAAPCEHEHAPFSQVRLRRA